MKTELDKRYWNTSKLIKDIERLRRKNKALRQEVKLLKQRVKEAVEFRQRIM